MMLFKNISRFLLITGLLIGSLNTFAQCDDEDFLDQCADQLGEFVFIKSFNVDEEDMKKSSDKEYSYVFSKGTTYLITICDQGNEDNKLVLELFDRNRKPILSSYNKKTKKHYAKIQYPCSATGVYYLNYSFQGKKPGCGVSILGFKK